MTFQVDKINHTVFASEIQMHDAFEMNGEIYVRIDAPSNIAKVDDDSILAISIETWQIEGVKKNREVQPYLVIAKAQPEYQYKL